MNKKANKLFTFDEHIKQYYKKHPKEIVNLLAAVLEDFNNDKTFDDETFRKVLLDLAKIKGVAQTARKAGMNRVSLYKALSREANPSFRTICNITETLGIKMSFSFNSQR